MRAVSPSVEVRRGCLPLILAVLLGGVLPVAGQTRPSLLARPARLHIEGVGVEEAIRALQRHSGISMAYSSDLLPSDRRVSCRCDSLTVREALDTILAGTGLRYQEGRRQIFIGLGERNGEGLASQRLALAGLVVEAGSGGGVGGAELVLIPSGRRTLSGKGGRFIFSPPVPGEYHLRVRALGFLETEQEVLIDTALGPDVMVELFRAPIPLEEIVISPGRFGFLGTAGGAMGTRISRDEIEAIPQLGDDAFGASQRMPGVASGDITTRLNVRGSTGRDLLVRLDGLELYEPFHLRDADGVFGIVDIQSLGQIDLVTGGFGVEHGGRFGGLFDLRTRSPPETGTRTTFGASLSSLSATSQGSFLEGRGDWLVAVRRGFLDIVLDISDYGDDFSPAYWDALGKARYRLSEKNLLGLNVLVAGDDMDWSDNQTGSDLTSTWANRYLWGSWKADLRPGVRANTLLALGGVSKDRGGQSWIPGGGTFSPLSARVRDRAEFSFRRIQQAWQVDLSGDLLLKVGADIEVGRGEYDYFGRTEFLDLDGTGQLIRVPDSTLVDLGVGGREMAAWGALRGRAASAVTWEAGVRFDHQTHTGDSDLAPRVLFRWDPGNRLSFKASWGRYFQAQGIQELSTPDGEVSFHPSEMAEQVALGVEAQLPGGVVGRVEGYLRSVASPRPEFLNLSREINPFLEIQTDRVRIDPTEGRARGLEFLLGGGGDGSYSWSASYALAEAKQRVAGRWVPRTLDQRHALNLHGAYRLGEKWQFSGAYQFHTGWPVTRQVPYEEVVTSNGAQVSTILRRRFGALNGDRLPSYRRVDLRVTRFVDLADGRLELFLDVFNATDERNLRGYEYGFDPMGLVGARVQRTPGEELLPILPTVGFRWVF